ncbi:MAG: RDD family protein [Archangium sp.]
MNPANFGPRVGARAIDMLLLTAVEVAVGQRTGYGYDWLVGGSAFVILYFVVSDVLFGATVGKRVLGLRVHDASGAKVSWAAAFKRELFILIGSIPAAGPLIALGVWIWFGVRINESPERVGPHDAWAGSRVTKAAAAR